MRLHREYVGDVRMQRTLRADLAGRGYRFVTARSVIPAQWRRGLLPDLRLDRRSNPDLLDQAGC